MENNLLKGEGCACSTWGINDQIIRRKKKTLCKLCLRGWGFHAKPAFFCNILNSDLYIDALIIEIFQIFLVVKVHFKIFLLVC